LLRIVHRVLTHPATVLLGVGLGFVCGFGARDFSQTLRPVADMYVALLSMCLLPILVSALVWGIGQMLRARETHALFGRMAVIYGLGLMVPCAVGIAVALVFQPGASLGDEAQKLLGTRLQSVQPDAHLPGLIGFLTSIIPPNVFQALSQGQFISIVFFCALAGLALGVVRAPGADETLRVLNALYQTFITVFHWVLVPLPLGLFAIVAYNLSNANYELLKALLTYCTWFWVAGLLVLAVHVLSLAVVTRTPPWRPLLALRGPLVMAFATDNPFVALYSAIESLQKSYRVPRAVADTVVPFGVLANQHGQVLLFSFTAVFVAQVYGVDLGATQLAMLALGVVLAGAAAAGGGAALAPILAPVLIGAGVPDSLAVVVLATTQPVVANLSSTLTVQATCNLAVFAAHGRRQEEDAAEPAALPDAARQGAA